MKKIINTIKEEAKQNHYQIFLEELTEIQILLQRYYDSPYSQQYHLRTEIERLRKKQNTIFQCISELMIGSKGALVDLFLEEMKHFNTENEDEFLSLLESSSSVERAIFSFVVAEGMKKLDPLETKKFVVNLSCKYDIVNETFAPNSELFSHVESVYPMIQERVNE